ncbi:DNA alkylation repair protein [Dactylosporangium sp. AC04546]|uniref:DNA alkylation repair protein n=1 Tax=Dactylosporangium sp. AC04546 TaxID=2862460 RepID=UPI001EDD104C|nr:DNA alkylation repair protein [Dactylosporangium sp. AC04546]WVK85621.1 DNA alkylation repair protein [Dactylosporangium sp. AC04546]
MIERLQAAFTAGADPGRAGPMKAYMRDQFEFLGLTSEPRRALTREVLAGAARPTERDLVEVALACWALPEREYQYFACDYLRRHAKVLTPAALPAIRTLITTKSWWDTVDILAANVVGPMVTAHPELRTTMDEWAGRPGELWTARTAILHQLRYGERTDTGRLFAYCESWAAEPDFFIRKAIGWALREYAKTDAAAVRAFVDGHPSLSPLSVREALRTR